MSRNDLIKLSQRDMIHERSCFTAVNLNNNVVIFNFQITTFTFKNRKFQNKLKNHLITVKMKSRPQHAHIQNWKMEALMVTLGNVLNFKKI